MRLPAAKTMAGTLAAVLVTGMVGSYLVFFTPGAPAPVTLTDPEDQAPAARVEESDPAGRWAVQEGSEAGYRVREKLARLPAPSDAVGRTGKVTGDIMLSGTEGNYAVSEINVEVDMTSLTSDSPRRDNAFRDRGLETDRFPTATFRSREPVDLPAGLRAGERLSLVLHGALTIHGVTRHVSIPVEARLMSGSVEVAGSLIIPLADFGITPPNVANIVSAEPTGTMEFRLVLEKVV